MNKHLGELTGPVLVFGGPYSNLAATSALRCRAEALQIPPQNIICTGDIVAYCADPIATVELVRDWGIHIVQGNCEEALGGKAPDCGCGFEEGSSCSLASIGWYNFASSQFATTAAQHLLTWMLQLPPSLSFTFGNKEFQVVHGSVNINNQFIFQSTNKEIKSNELASVDASVIIGGHCGLPFADKLASGYWLNAGVIGMPANDGTADGWYLLLEEKNKSLTASWHRLPYPAESSRERMRAMGLDNGYAEALVSGIWPNNDILPRKERSQQGTPLMIEPMLLQ